MLASPEGHSLLFVEGVALLLDRVALLLLGSEPGVLPLRTPFARRHRTRRCRHKTVMFFSTDRQITDHAARSRVSTELVDNLVEKKRSRIDQADASQWSLGFA